MYRASLLLPLLLLVGQAGPVAGDDLVVYPPVPGLAAGGADADRVRLANHVQDD